MLYGEMPASGGFRVYTRGRKKTALLRLPTSDEMAARINRQKSIITSLGRGKSKTEAVDTLAADLELFKKCRVKEEILEDPKDSQDADFTAAEARSLILQLTACDIESKTFDGAYYTVVTKTPFCETTHVLRDPSDDDLYQYGKFRLSHMDLPDNREEIGVRVEASVKLYDSIVEKTEGYLDGKVPAHHKHVVVGALMQILNAEDSQQIEIGPNS